MNKMNFTPFPILTTGRLKLRQLTDKDINEFFILKSDERLLKSYYAKAKTYEEAQEFIHKLNDGIRMNEWIIWGITLKDDNKLVGSICILNFSKEELKAEIGYELMIDWQGKGIMNEAINAVIEYGFNNIKLKLIEAYTSAYNASSVKLLEKNNFVRRENKTEINPSDGKVMQWMIYSLKNMNN
jgi:ribosomal-protein-alanine N-acetyltransferase